MKATSLVFGYFCINIAIWTINVLGVITLSREAIIDPTGLGALFDISAFTILTTLVGGATTAIIGILTRNVALSSGVLILWVFGIIFRPIQDVFVGLPRLVSAIFAEAPALGTVISQVVVAFSAFIFFMFLAEVVMGRDLI